MISFRNKSYIIQDLTNEIIDHLRIDGQSPNLITEDDAINVAKRSSDSRVIYSIIRNNKGFYEMKLMDRQLYPYTRKLLRDNFLLRIKDEDKELNAFIVESEFKGRLLDAIDIIGRKFKLSIVVR